MTSGDKRDAIVICGAQCAKMNKLRESGDINCYFVPSIISGDRSQPTYVVSTKDICKLLDHISDPLFNIVACDDDQVLDEMFYLSYDSILPHLINHMLNGVGLKVSRGFLHIETQDDATSFQCAIKRTLSLLDLDVDILVKGFDTTCEMVQWAYGSKYAPYGFKSKNRLVECMFRRVMGNYPKILIGLRKSVPKSDEDVADVTKKCHDHIRSEMNELDDDWSSDMSDADDHQVVSDLVARSPVIKALVGDDPTKLDSYTSYLCMTTGVPDACRSGVDMTEHILLTYKLWKLSQ